MTIVMHVLVLLLLHSMHVRNRGHKVAHCYVKCTYVPGTWSPLRQCCNKCFYCCDIQSYGISTQYGTAEAPVDACRTSWRQDTKRTSSFFTRTTLKVSNSFPCRLQKQDS